MFRASTAHQQEVRCMYVANGTSKMTVSEQESTYFKKKESKPTLLKIQYNIIVRITKKKQKKTRK
jgi:hypothetical protein